MMLRIVRAVGEVETQDELHLGRLLVLLLATEGRNKTPLSGIMKLAKLDFLLRYPASLERAIGVIDGGQSGLEIDEQETTTIEAKMVRFRYGPWDFRYRRWLGILHGKGLIDLRLHGRAIETSLTEHGRTVAEQIAGQDSFKTLYQRSRIIKKHFGSIGGSKLRDFIYQTFPELQNLRWGEEITK